ncbi:hypothetical protein SAMN05444005_104100 [Flavobacterium urocaniciphilum]|uniref:Uncharacterized protein n=1 Tax=Flavobacterium urocaniciphilum TaxID=1299341 RepID=A0A1H9C851_9FLAO|nr:hypothetical protein SAMN05444005_104100 [Flavobacterium urocaniciphilum]
MSLFFGNVNMKNNAAITCKNPVIAKPYGPNIKNISAKMFIPFIILNESIMINNVIFRIRKTAVMNV